MSELRPSFGERDTYLNLLSAAYADGTIDDEEFDRRTQGVLSAVTHKDAIAQFEGLPAPNVLPAPAKPAPPPRPGPPPSVPPQPPAGPLYSIEPAPVRFTPAPRRSDDGPGAMIVKVVVGVAAAAIGLTVIGGFISAGKVVFFSSQADGSLSISRTAGTVVPAVETVEVSDGVILALKNVEAELMGVPLETTLAWVDDEPFLDVTFVNDSAEIDTVRFDLAGNQE